MSDDRKRARGLKLLSPGEVQRMQRETVNRVGRKAPAARDAHLERLGLEPRGPGRPKKHEVRLNITAPVELDEAMREIAEEDGVKVRDVWRAAAEQYVKLRRRRAP